MTIRVCTIDGCNKPRNSAFGWCAMHTWRWMKYGDLDHVRIPPTLIERIRSRFVRTPKGCWEWTGQKLPGGYGVISVDTKSRLAHRVAYELFVGPIPAGLDIDHLCRNRACVNPSHMEPVTERENTLRSPIAPAAINARKTHCIRGHEYTPENTYRRGEHGRECRECMRIRGRRRSAA